MQNAQNAEYAAVWSAAHHRRTEDLSNLFLKRSKKTPGADLAQSLLKPRLALMRGIAIAIIAFAAVTSVSAVVHAKKTPPVALRPTGPMPAVNVP